jgi:hypothetical protein
MNEPKRITIPLSPDEVAALRKRAAQELRDPRDQARYMVRAALGLNSVYLSTEKGTS